MYVFGALREGGEGGLEGGGLKGRDLLYIPQRRYYYSLPHLKSPKIFFRSLYVQADEFPRWLNGCSCVRLIPCVLNLDLSRLKVS